MDTLRNTARLDGVDPQVWLAEVLARTAGAPLSRHRAILPWNWNPIPIPTPSKAA